MHSPHVLIGKKRVSPVAIHKKVNVQAVWRWSAAILWMGAIFALSATPSIATPLEPVYDFTFKKLAHVTEYGILTILLASAVEIHIRHKGYALLTTALVAILYAFSDEWHQTFVPGREGTLRDVAIDALGVVGMSIWLKSKSKGFHRREPSAAKAATKVT
jgi:VanZ family protein